MTGILKAAALLCATTALSAPGVVAADSIIPLQGNQEPATASLGRILAERGWSVTTEADQSILVRPRQEDADYVQTPAPQDAPPQRIAASAIDAAYWQASLEPHGWGVEQDRDGSIVLIPGDVEQQSVAETAAISPPPQISAQIELAELRDRLSPHGWGVERDRDGSVLLIPGAAEVPAAVVAVPAQASPRPAANEQIDIADWRATLEPHGWSVERDSDGSVVLIPGGAEQQQVVQTTPSVSPDTEVSAQVDLAALRDRLGPHGWGVERDPDGSLLLTPGAVDRSAVAAIQPRSPGSEMTWRVDLASLSVRETGASHSSS